MIALKGLVLESCGTICSFIVSVANMIITHSYSSIIEITKKKGCAIVGNITITLTIALLSTQYLTFPRTNALRPVVQGVTFSRR
jgi:hypothetical protein